MRICYIANGNSVHSARWIMPFVERGHTVHLLSYVPVERSWKGLTEVVDLTRLTDVRKVRFALWAWWTRRHIQRIKPDVLHAHQVQAAGWLGAMANYHPFVVSGWGSDILIEPHKSLFRRLLVWFVMRQSDLLTVPSRFMYDAARTLGIPERAIRLVPWGVETDVFRPFPDDRNVTRAELGISSASRVILSPRKVRPLYNIDILFDAIRLARRQVNRLQVVLLRASAESDYLAQLERQIADFGLEDIVLWLPRQESPSDMARLYRMADVCVSIPMSEGYGFSVYEALASGCPTVISDLPIFRAELEDGLHTVKVPVRDVVGTSQRLVEVLTNTNLQQTIRQNGLRMCRYRTVDERIEQTEILYRQMMRRSCIEDFSEE
jgi:glycosyltransferase involved in cell wall biosynthesis